MMGKPHAEGFDTMKAAFGRVGVTPENAEDATTRIEIAEFFPNKDREAIRALALDNLRSLRRGDDETTMLWPAYAPDQIGQTHFAISESVPLRFYGVVPCIGVGLYNPGRKRVMFTHIEARDNSNKGNKEAARILVDRMAALFREEPDLILFHSEILGAFSYHDDIMEEVGHRFPFKRTIKNRTSDVFLDPLAQRLKVAEAYNGWSREISL